MLWPGPVGVNSGVFGNSINLAVDRHQYCTSTHLLSLPPLPHPPPPQRSALGYPVLNIGAQASVFFG